jgi:hypothetical protein
VPPARAPPGQVATTGGRRRLVARLAPLALPASARVRLRRVRPEALYKEESGQLTVPLAPGEAPVEALTGLLVELVPAAAATPDGPVPAAEEERGRGGRRDSSRATARR